ncbi:MAG: outer membrane beta-barrel protein [Ginsengibacter sp.]
MQHLENDMDELFQRAAENYPLKKGEGDWESIAKRIADKSDPPAIIAPSKSIGRKKIIPLFLLLFIGSVSWFTFQYYQHRTDVVPGKNVMAGNVKEGNKTSAPEKNKLGITGKNTAGVTDKKDKSNFYNSIGLAGNNITDPEKGNTSRAAGTGIRNVNPGKEKSLTGETYNNESSIKPENKYSPAVNRNEANNDNNPAENKISKEKIIAKNTELEEELSAAENAGDALVIHNEKKNDKALQNPQRKKGMYVGVVAGPDFSKVHSGSFDHSGVNAGIVAGYRFNKKISLESGIIWDKKYYTSEGKNFSMDKVGSTMPSGMVINNLESNNSFIEIPLKVKFDFFTKRNNNLFIAGGVSAYIITREQNMYHVTFNGDNKDVLSVYEKNNYGLPAVASLSLGYEKNVSKSFDLRIEPYLRIPLRGMGVGSLPITSAGLQIGIIGRLK